MLVMLMGVVFAQAGPAPFDWGSLVGGALGSSPAALVLAWRLWRSDRENDQKDAAIRRLEEEHRAERRTDHERELARAERLVVTLSEATRSMNELHRTMEAQRRRDDR